MKHGQETIGSQVGPDDSTRYSLTPKDINEWDKRTIKEIIAPGYKMTRERADEIITYLGRIYGSRAGMPNLSDSLEALGNNTGLGSKG